MYMTAEVNYGLFSLYLNLNFFKGYVWCCMPEISAFRNLKQEDEKFEASLEYVLNDPV